MKHRAITHILYLVELPRLGLDLLRPKPLWEYSKMVEDRHLQPVVAQTEILQFIGPVPAAAPVEMLMCWQPETGMVVEPGDIIMKL
jgi:hypothetical protein